MVAHSLCYARGRALDLGAGSAKYKSIIAPACASYVALDAFPNANIDIVSDIEHTPLADASVDTLYCTQVLEHVRRPWIAAGEIRRVLAPGGVCIVSAPFLEPYHADPEDYFRYTVRGLEALFGEPDFEILESGAYGGAAAVLVSFFRRRYFDTYKPARRYSWRFVRVLVALASWIDRRNGRGRVYLNSYLIARKRA